MKDSTLPESKKSRSRCLDDDRSSKTFTDKKIYLIHYIKVGNQETYSNRDWYPILTSFIVSTLKVLYLQVGFDDIIIDRVSYSITR